MKEISTRLSNEGWPLVDVTLTQFKLPTSETWQGDKDAYILDMLKEASDHSLLELGQHVGFRFEEAPMIGVDPPFWRKRMFRLFISHLSSHKVFAAELQEALLRFGISSFVAHNDIEPTLEWQAQIETALSTAESLVALLHPDFHASKWTDQEIGFAMGKGLPVFAVRFGQDPYGFIGRFQGFAGHGKTALAIARELFDAYRKNKQTQRRMAEILVNLFEDSASFAEAKARIGYLEELEVWESGFPSRIESAVEANSQVSVSWGVPERTQALAKKWKAHGV
ncbi:MAG: TIR domain-containing protein [Deinococcota bacterium]|nr:TIR domain-containing protein [Deinococcota bacterium]